LIGEVKCRIPPTTTTINDVTSLWSFDLGISFPISILLRDGSPRFLADAGLTPDEQAMVGGGTWERLRAAIRR